MKHCKYKIVAYLLLFSNNIVYDSYQLCKAKGVYLTLIKIKYKINHTANVFKHEALYVLHIERQVCTNCNANEHLAVGRM